METPTARTDRFENVTSRTENGYTYWMIDGEGRFRTRELADAFFGALQLIRARIAGLPTNNAWEFRIDVADGVNVQLNWELNGRRWEVTLHARSRSYDFDERKPFDPAENTPFRGVEVNWSAYGSTTADFTRVYGLALQWMGELAATLDKHFELRAKACAASIVRQRDEWSQVAAAKVEKLKGDVVERRPDGSLNLSRTILNAFNESMETVQGAKERGLTKYEVHAMLTRVGLKDEVDQAKVSAYLSQFASQGIVTRLGRGYYGK